MRYLLKHSMAGLVMTLFLASSFAFAQDTSTADTKAADTSGARKKDDASKKKEFSLSDVTRVSTEEAAKSAAHKATAPKNKNKEADATADSVTEFSPASPDATKTDKKDSKSSPKRSGSKIHGEAHGATGSLNTGGHEEGGAVGATSKSGKTSVYVSGQNTSTPH